MLLRRSFAANRLVWIGLVTLVVANAATIGAASGILYAGVDRRAEARVDSNMRVAWHLLTILGPGPRIQDGRMLVGAKVINDDDAFVDNVQALVGGNVTVFQADRRIATNVRDADGRRAIGTLLPPGPVYQAVLVEHRPFRGVIEVFGRYFYAGYDPIRDEAGEVIGMLFVGVDKAGYVTVVTEARNLLLGVSAAIILLTGLIFAILMRRYQAKIDAREQSLARAVTNLDAALANMVNGLAMWGPDARLLTFNRQMSDITGIPYDKLYVGLPYPEFLRLFQKAGAFTGMAIEDVFAQREELWRNPKPLSFVEKVRHDRTALMSMRPMPDGTIVVTIEDITDRKHAEEQIAFMARHDALTGVGNRILFQDRLAEALQRQTRIALFYLDLDRFKAVNDTYGHPVGDRLLQQVADRLGRFVRSSDTVARLGGDEFAVIYDGFEHDDAAMTVAARIVEHIGEPYEIDGHLLSIGIGIAVAPSRDVLWDVLVKQADLALYRAKTQGGGTLRVFETGMVMERSAL